MNPPDDPVRLELERVLESDASRTGDVHRLTREGLSPDQIASRLGVPTSSFVASYRRNARSLLAGHVPSGRISARQTAGYVRGVRRKQALSHEAVAYLDDLIRGLERVAGAGEGHVAPALPLGEASPPPNGTLRAQVDEAVRARTRLLVERIRSERRLHADDYHQVVVADFALDVVHRLVHEQPMSRTTTALLGAERLDLRIEHAVVEWSLDLPLTAPLIDAARGRLDYWRSSP